MKTALIYVACGLVLVGPAAADYSEKITLGSYLQNGGPNAVDLNWRHSFEHATGWLGEYHDNSGYSQARSGLEYDYHSDLIAFVPSMQLAEGGFRGGSLYAEIGAPFFAIAGFGRTNLKPYYNLNFDPNDAIQWGAGWRDEAGDSVTAFVVQDDRTHTGQTNAHLVGRWLPSEHTRLTVDLLHKHGRSDPDSDETISAWSITGTWDWDRWFVRVAFDPHANYGTATQTRLAAGIRF